MVEPHNLEHTPWGRCIGSIFIDMLSTKQTLVFPFIALVMGFSPLGIDNIFISTGNFLRIYATSAKLLPEDVAFKEYNGAATGQESPIACKISTSCPVLLYLIVFMIFCCLKKKIRYTYSFCQNLFVLVGTSLERWLPDVTLVCWYSNIVHSGGRWLMSRIWFVAYWGEWNRHTAGTAFRRDVVSAGLFRHAER